MTLLHTYQDAYLKAQITDEREQRASDEVATFGQFSSDYRDRLVVLRAYLIACLECQAQPDDLFAQKLKHYRQEWDRLLAQAEGDAASQGAGAGAALFSIALERA